jgi:hypothetical protein
MARVAVHSQTRQLLASETLTSSRLRVKPSWNVSTDFSSLCSCGGALLRLHKLSSSSYLRRLLSGDNSDTSTYGIANAEQDLSLRVRCLWRCWSWEYQFINIVTDIHVVRNDTPQPTCPSCQRHTMAVADEKLKGNNNNNNSVCEQTTASTKQKLLMNLIFCCKLRQHSREMK